MAEEEGGAKHGGGKAPIIIKKKKHGAHPHHGGAWKIAYADFVTAMMAFFLLMWLTSSVKKETLDGIAHYFAPASVSPTTSGSGGVMGGKTVTSPGAKSSSDDTQDSGSSNQGSGQEVQQDATKTMKEPENVDELLAKMEDQMFDQAEQELKKALEQDSELRAFQDNFVIDRVPEGLRIQIIDQEKRDMFASGSAEMYPYMDKLLGLVVRIVNKLPNKISVSGHTDASPFSIRGGLYTNWELSSDRANASRRSMVKNGLAPDRVVKVIGRAETDPFLKEDIKASRNRRISVILLKDSKLKAESSPLPPMP